VRFVLFGVVIDQPMSGQGPLKGGKQKQRDINKKSNAKTPTRKVKENTCGN